MAASAAYPRPTRERARSVLAARRLGLGFSQRRGRAAGSRPAIPAQNMSGTPCFLRERRRFSRQPVGGRRRRRNDRFYIGPKFGATVARRPPRLGAAGSAERLIIPAAGARPVCTAENLGVAARRLWERDRFRWVSHPKTGAPKHRCTQRPERYLEHPETGAPKDRSTQTSLYPKTGAPKDLTTQRPEHPNIAAPKDRDRFRV